jgi:simple sugar transport system permease protein
VIGLDVVVTGVRLATPLLFAALGGVISERSGVVNVALEGKLLVGAFAAAAVTVATGDPWLGVVGGAGAGAALGLLHALAGVVLRGDQIVGGFREPPRRRAHSVLTGAPAARQRTHRPSAACLTWEHRTLAAGGWRSRSRRRHVLAHTRRPARARGGTRRLRSPRVWRRCACGSCVRARGRARRNGGHLALDASQFVKNMSAGAAFRTRGRDLRQVASASGGGRLPLFGTTEALQIRLQGQGVPTQFVQMIPYVLTMVALAGLVGRSRAPSALGRALPMER